MSLGVNLENVCPHCGHSETEEITDGITYNLMPMFRAAGWDHNDYDGWSGEEMLPIAKEVLAKLVADPDEFREFNPPNGWGTYEDAVWFFDALTSACERCPKYKLKFYR